MDVYETSSRDRDVFGEARRLLGQHELAVKYFAALVGVVLVGFGLRAIYENMLGQVFGAMLIWFSILFGIGGVLITAAFVLQGAVRDLRH